MDVDLMLKSKWQKRVLYFIPIFFLVVYNKLLNYSALRSSFLLMKICKMTFEMELCVQVLSNP